MFSNLSVSSVLLITESVWVWYTPPICILMSGSLWKSKNKAHELKILRNANNNCGAWKPQTHFLREVASLPLLSPHQVLRVSTELLLSPPPLLLLTQLHLFPFLHLLVMSLLHSPQLFLSAQEIWSRDRETDMTNCCVMWLLTRDVSKSTSLWFAWTTSHRNRLIFDSPDYAWVQELLNEVQGLWFWD